MLNDIAWRMAQEFAVWYFSRGVRSVAFFAIILKLRNRTRKLPLPETDA
jgi:hypothetical protein